MGMHTIRWRSGATDSGQIPCLPVLGLRQCALSPFPACCYRRSLLANTDLQHGACRCAGMRYASASTPAQAQAWAQQAQQLAAQPDLFCASTESSLRFARACFGAHALQRQRQRRRLRLGCSACDGAGVLLPSHSLALEAVEDVGETEVVGEAEVVADALLAMVGVPSTTFELVPADALGRQNSAGQRLFKFRVAWAKGQHVQLLASTPASLRSALSEITDLATMHFQLRRFATGLVRRSQSRSVSGNGSGAALEFGFGLDESYYEGMDGAGAGDDGDGDGDGNGFGLETQMLTGRQAAWGRGRCALPSPTVYSSTCALTRRPSRLWPPHTHMRARA